MVKESDVLRIVKEDVLEAVGRKNGKIPLESMRLEITVSRPFVLRAIKELEEKSLIKISQERNISN